jgi:uncharacterized repeat protein (TIGR01451 family)
MADHGNDDFANAIELIGTSVTTNDTNISATFEVGEPNHAGVFNTPTSVWWKWTAPSSIDIAIDTFGSNFDTVLAVYTGSQVDALSEIASNDDFGGSQSRVEFSAVSGTTYYIAVAGFNGSIGNIQLSLAPPPPPPANDNFVDAIELVGTSTSTAGTNISATSETGEPNHGSGSGDSSVWWKWTAPSTFNVTVDIFGSDFNATFDVYTGSQVDALTKVSYLVNNFSGAVTMAAVSGTTYFIAVDGISTGAGNIQLSLAPDPSPDNDDFANAIVLAGTSISTTGTNISSTKESNETNHAGNNGGSSVWWSWTASSSVDITIDTFGSDFNTTLAVYTGSQVDTLTTIASNDDNSGTTSQVTFTTVSGTTYYIVVDGFDAEEGFIDLSITPPIPVQPSTVGSDDFANANELVGPSITVIDDNSIATKEFGEPDHASGTGGKSLWWKWTAPGSGTVTIDTLGSSFSTLLGVYTGSQVDALTLVASNNIHFDFQPTPLSKVDFNAVAGTTYYIAIDDEWNGGGLVQFLLELTPTPYLVKNINSDGNIGSFILDINVFNGIAYFSANTTASGNELWKSDGTSNGTVMIADINPGVDSSSSRNFIEFNNDVYFTAEDASGSMFWKYETLTDSLSVIKELDVSNPVVFNGLIYFDAGNAFWQSDGTDVGTIMVTNNLTGCSEKVVIDTTMYFFADDGSLGCELWQSDGTSVGTVLVSDINTGPTGSVVEYISNKLTILNNTLYFVADDGSGDELWKSDGTDVGTQQVKDINSGVNDSMFAGDTITVFNNELYFSADDGTGREPWKSDGTNAGTVLLKDINPDDIGSFPGDFKEFNGALYFYADDGLDFGSDLWVTDGTEAGTQMFQHIFDEPAECGPITCVFSINGTGSSLAVVNGLLFFTGSSFNTGGELWATDGTVLGTQQVKDIIIGPIGSDPGGFSEFNNKLLFVATHSDSGSELWLSDGTITGTTLIKDIEATDQSANPDGFVSFKGEMYFTADDGNFLGQELWKTDGTETGTVFVADINPNGHAFPSELTVVNDLLYFSATREDVGQELFVTDGSEEGTRLIKDIWSAEIAPTIPNNSSPNNFVSFNGKLYFVAEDGVNGRELWVSDGTDVGTFMLKDINSTGDSNLGSFTVFNNLLFFTVDDPINGIDLWKTDGTMAGTVRVKDINPSGDPQVSRLTISNNILFFIATNGINGVELWKTDGTDSGTQMVIDWVPGAGSTGPIWLTPSDDGLYFTPEETSIILRTDGTASGTEDFTPWQDYTFTLDEFDLIDKTFSRLFEVNGDIYFLASNEIFFEEIHLWKLGDENEFGPGNAHLLKSYLFRDLNTNTPHSFTDASNNKLYFVGEQFSSDQLLWSTDGDVFDNLPLGFQELSRTTKVPNAPGLFFISGSDMDQTVNLNEINGVLYFKGYNESGSELWALPLDLDGDGIGEPLDPDDDNDGILDINDDFPFDDYESVDHDGDGIGNNADNDDDNDGILDRLDSLQFNFAPIISGAPSTSSLIPGSPFSFTPTVNDPDGPSRTFSIQNKPMWLSFDTSTGELSGTPLDGDYHLPINITITVDDGVETDSLNFSLEVLDVQAPVTFVAPNAGDYSTPQSVTLNCIDFPIGGSGCSNNYYTIDGSDPTTSSTLYSGPIQINTDATLKFFALDNSGNTETFQTAVYGVDADNPTVAITAPIANTVHDSTTTTSIDGTASDSGTGVVNVELQISGGGKAVQVSGGGLIASSPEWVAATDLGSGTWSSWTYDTSTLNWETETTYTINARAIDSAGNQSQSSINFDYFSGTPAVTSCDVTLSSSSILFNGTMDASLKLTKTGFPNADLIDSAMTLRVIAPDTTQTILGPFSTNAFGQFTEQNLGAGVSGIAFNQKGAWTVVAEYAGVANLAPCVSEPALLLVGSAAGYAVVVQGRLSNQEGIDSHNKTTNRIYRTLIDRGFDDQEIFYFNHNVAQDANNDGTPDNVQPDIGVDSAPTKAAIQDAIEGLATAVNNNPAPMYVIMVDHGGDNTFFLDGTETISPTELNSWLNTLEGGLDPTALLEPRVVINGSCYSGGFIDELSKSNRLIISSAAANEESYKGPLEADGIRSGEYFIEEFFKELGKGETFTDAFNFSTEKTEIFTRRGGGSSNSSNAYFDDAVQHPLLDDDGNGVGSNLISLGSSDGTIANALLLGNGPDFDTNSANNPAEVISVTETLFVADGDTQVSLFAVPNDIGHVNQAYIEVRDPLVELTPGNGTEQLEANFTRVQLLAPNNPGNPFSDRYNTTYNGIITQGKYDVFYYVEDNETGALSPSKRSIIYKKKSINPVPSSFNLISPASGSTTNIVLLLDWEDAIDPDGVTYSLTIATDAAMTNVIYHKEEIVDSIFPVDNTVGIEDLTTYYWQIVAVDSFGEQTISSNGPFSFTTDNQNDGSGFIQGIVVSDIGFAKLTNAHITGNGFDFIAPNGSFIVIGPAGTVNLTATVNGYTDKQLIDVQINSGQLTSDVNFAMSPDTGDADISVTLLANAATVVEGDTITYTATVTNNGPDTVSDATLNIALPGTTSFVSASVACGTPVGNNLSCTVPTLTNSQVTGFTVTVTTQTAGSPSVTASIITEVADSVAGNNSETVQVTVLADTDGDGVPDVSDAFPTDPNETTDTDGDGVGDNADTTYTVVDGDVAFLINAINLANNETNNPGLDIIELADNGNYQLLTTQDSAYGNSGLPAITSDILIKGNGASILGSNNNNACDGSGDEFRVFIINAATGKLTLSSTTVSDGCAFASEGGGIAVINGGKLTLNNSTVINNNAQTAEGIYSNTGSMTINR